MTAWFVLGAFAKLRIQTIGFLFRVFLSVSMPIHPSEYIISAPTKRIFMKLNIFRKYVQKIDFDWNLTRIPAAVPGDLRTVMIYRVILLRIKNVSDKTSRANQNKHFTFNIYIYIFLNSFLYEVMWKKYRRTGQATDENMVHVHCFENALTMCVTYCFSTATLIARRRFSVTFIPPVPALLYFIT
jgi:hypothetical protein